MRRPLLLAFALCACTGAAATPGAETSAPSQEAGRPDDGAEAALDGGETEPVDGAVAPDSSLPRIHDASGASPSRVRALVRAALAGLGFVGPEAPNQGDLVFVGRHYLAWIDETGFYGKMNGLWSLNGRAGDDLDFVLKDPDGRPVNAFIPGDDGEGRFAGGYKGAEHVEFPSRVPEPNDDPACAKRDWCNQYGLNEAPPITHGAIPWWSACNAGTPSFSTRFAPVVSQPLAGGGLKLVYEGPLVKEADGDGDYDGDACHADYLFPDGVRRRVNLRVGYELFADRDYFDRTQQLENPPGNPSLAGDMSLIGGFVMTSWPQPHYLKRLHRFWRPEVSPIEVDHGGLVALPGAAWTQLSTRPPPPRDVIVAWAKQPFSMSVSDAFAAGRSATIAHVGPSDNEDVGGCLCVVHGAIELGGGLLHAGVSLPIAGSTRTIEARRRLTIPTAQVVGAIAAKSYEPKAGLSHAVGRAEADGWSASTGPDAKGHMIFGPYAKDWGGGAVQAVVSMMVDDHTADDLPVVTLEIYDATAGAILASREVRRRELRAPMKLQRFTLDAGLEGHAGDEMELRVYWHDVSYVKVSGVTVNLTDR